VNFYLTNWGVNPAKIILGLMPGLDDTGKNMSLLHDALNFDIICNVKRAGWKCTIGVFYLIFKKIISYLLL
jgi:hypothetical protein